MDIVRVGQGQLGLVVTQLLGRGDAKLLEDWCQLLVRKSNENFFNPSTCIM